MAHAAPKPVASEGVRPNVPEWLAALGVGPGEYQFETKARLRRIQTSASWPHKARVYANLALHTMGFRQEMAVKQVKGGALVPLTPQDVANETGIDRRYVRRMLQELEKEGFCRREGLHRGKVRLYAYAVPREPVETEFVAVYGYKLPDGLPVEVFKELRRLGVPIPSDCTVNGALPVILGALNGYKHAVLGARNVLKEAVLGALDGHVYKEERYTEKDISIGGDPPPPPPLVDNTTKAEEEDPPANIKNEENEETPKPKTPLEEAKAEYPPERWDDAKATEAHREHIKSHTQHQMLIKGIRRHKESERWQEEGGRWIPFASNFISKRLYEYDPPPKLTTGKARNGPAYTIFDRISKAKGAS